MKIKKNNLFTISLVLVSFLVLGILDITVQSENNIKEANSINYLILNQEYNNLHLEKLISDTSINKILMYILELKLNHITPNTMNTGFLNKEAGG